MSSRRSGDLSDLPNNLSVDFLKDADISLKSKQQGYRFFSEGYFQNTKIFKDDDDILQVYSECHRSRSQRKNAKPHNLQLHMDISVRAINFAHCSCMAG